MSFINKHLNLFPIILFLLIILGFYSPSIFKNKIPVPADLLLGAYYPWLDYSWGYPVSMPVKNPLISDVYSQIYPWKSIIAETLRDKQIPLWNQYSFSGYPLLANFQSGAFNPFNLFMVFFGDQNGWILMLIFQMFFSFVFMYLFLKTSSKNIFANTLASIIYGLSAYAVCWSQFMTVGFAMIWLPLIFYLIKQKRYIWLPFAYFFLMSAGHMQSLIFGSLFSVIYYFYLNFSLKRFSSHLPYIFSVAIGLGYMFIQILPTLELYIKSIRLDENYIKSYHFGLLPLSQLVTFLSPDYFGNPTTNNYWGFFNYQESVIYCTVLAFIALIYFVFYLRKVGSSTKFFLLSSLISLLFIFDNPVSRLIYYFKIPFVSTSAAGRLVLLLTFSLSIIVRDFINDLSTKIDKHKLKLTLILVFSLIISQLIITYLLKEYFLIQGQDFKWYQNLNTSFRNTALYSVIGCLYLGIIYASLKFKPLIYFLLILVVFEQFRFGWKYLPFVDRRYVFASTPVIDYLKNDLEKYFRVIAEKGPILPANSWALYRLSSPVGYDPLLVKDYFIEFNESVNGNPGDKSVSRYLEPEKYPADILGIYNVKYLLALKNKNKQEINSISWKKVFEDRSVLILENKAYQPRVIIETLDQNKAPATAAIVSSTANSVSIKYSVSKDNFAKITLADSWFPGWIAKDNGRIIEYEHNSSSRIARVTGSGILEYYYFPKSFTIGIFIVTLSLITHLMYFLWQKK
jgi:hypothetical protein